MATKTQDTQTFWNAKAAEVLRGVLFYGSDGVLPTL
jgi:hypothetical protein